MYTNRTIFWSEDTIQWSKNINTSAEISTKNVNLKDLYHPILAHFNSTTGIGMLLLYLWLCEAWFLFVIQCFMEPLFQPGRENGSLGPPTAASLPRDCIAFITLFKAYFIFWGQTVNYSLTYDMGSGKCIRLAQQQWGICHESNNKPLASQYKHTDHDLNKNDQPHASEHYMLMTFMFVTDGKVLTSANTPNSTLKPISVLCG